MRQYRRDIDGLRAVAVLPVILFHAGLGFPGGFVGVDVFFVISGYLITGIIADEIEQNDFSLVAFYERRVRRIIPALLAMVAISIIAAYLLFMPPEFTLFGRSLTATMLFSSNVRFWKEAGYFDTVSAFKPLLHTWSLAVEEQFYIIFPIVLIALRKRPDCIRLLALAALIGASFFLSTYWVIEKPAAAFFLAPARFWELGLGALLSLTPAQIISHRWNSSLAVLGLLMIGIAVLGFSDALPFPGPLALVPCLGAVLIIATGQLSNPVAKLLQARPLVFIGKISYPLYLWHWPIIVFAEYKLAAKLTPQQAGLALIASFALAILSWAVLERPVRERRFLARRGALFGGAAAVMASCCLAGLLISHGKGFPARLPLAAQQIYAAKDDRSRFSGPDCMTDTKLSGPTDADVRAGRLCGIGTARVKDISFLVWGDSHSGAMAPAIDKTAVKYGRKGLLAAQGSCPPLLDYQSTSDKKINRDACVARNAAVLDLLDAQHIPVVFLVARWPREVLGAEYGREGPFFDPKVPYKITDRSREVRASLHRTLDELSKRNIHAVIVMDVPEPGYDVPYAMAKAAVRNSTPDLNPSLETVYGRQHQALAILKQEATQFGAAVIDPTPAFCDEKSCHIAIDGTPLYVDADHLTKTAAERLSGLFEPAFTGTSFASSAPEGSLIR